MQKRFIKFEYSLEEVIMRWFRLMKHHALGRRPILRAYNPRIGTSIIPLNSNDSEIFTQYLTDKVHSLYFEGSSRQLTQIIHHLRDDHGVTIQKMRLSIGRAKGRIMLLHLKLPDQQEIRRVIKLF